MTVLSQNQNEIFRMLTRDRVKLSRKGASSPLRNPLVAASALVALFGLLALLYVAQTGNLVETNYNIAHIKQEQSYLQARNEQLRLEIANLQSYERLQQEATLRGMVKPSELLYVQVEPVAKKAVAEPAQEKLIPGSPFVDLWNNAVNWFLRAIGNQP